MITRKRKKFNLYQPKSLKFILGNPNDYPKFCSMIAAIPDRKDAGGSLQKELIASMSMTI